MSLPFKQTGRPDQGPLNRADLDLGEKFRPNGSFYLRDIKAREYTEFIEFMEDMAIFSLYIFRPYRFFFKIYTKILNRRRITTNNKLTQKY